MKRKNTKTRKIKTSYMVPNRTLLLEILRWATGSSSRCRIVWYWNSIETLPTGLRWWKTLWDWRRKYSLNTNHSLDHLMKNWGKTTLACSIFSLLMEKLQDTSCTHGPLPCLLPSRNSQVLSKAHLLFFEVLWECSDFFVIFGLFLFVSWV